MVPWLAPRRRLENHVTIGQSFYVVANRPLLALYRERNMAAGLNAVHGARLAGAFDAAVDQVARECTLRADVVRRELPVVEVEGAMVVASEVLGRAVDVWNQHHGVLSEFVGGLVGGFVEGYLGIEGSGVGELLASVGNRFVHDTRIAEPMKELSVALQVYDQSLQRCAAILDSTPFVVDAARRTRQRRLAKRILLGSVVIGCAVVAGARGFSQTSGSPAGASPLNDTSASGPSLANTPVQDGGLTGAATSRPAKDATAPAPRTRGQPRTAAPPAQKDPRARANCLAACVSKCADDAVCERTCARKCPGS